MIRRAALSLLLTVIAASGADAARRRPVARPVPQTAIPAAAIDALASQAIAAGVPGISIAVSHGNAAYANGYGFTDSGKANAVTPESIFQIASVTKQFTAAAILALEEEGRLTTFDPVTQWIPELDLGGRLVTIEQLLTHTSGLRPGLELLVDPYSALDLATAIELIEEHGFVAEPGTREEYNNGGYWLLGVVIERAAEMPYAQYLKERLFEPAGLRRTAYCGVAPASPVPAGFLQLGNAAVPVAPIDMSVAFAAGALCSTASDLVRWSDALAAGMVISLASYQKMIAPGRLADGSTLYYGLGVGLGTIEERFATSHAGTIVGFESYLVHVPSERLAVAVLVNEVSNRADPGGIARAIAREILAGP
ncbi:MAG: serine hydrolase domain-containing protein [Thermoanaerobaculia bacterium]